MGDDLRRTIWFHSEGLGADAREAFESAIRGMPAIILRVAPSAEISVRPIPNDVREQWEQASAAHDDIIEIEDAVVTWMAERDRVCRLVFGANPDHRLARLLLQNNPLAEWGGTRWPIALCFQPGNPFLVWHEILHLFGAQDCYDKNGNGPTCEMRNCIMQWEPTSEHVGGEPFLCSRNGAAVRTSIERSTGHDLTAGGVR